MKIIICDDSVNLTRDIQYEVDMLKRELPGAEILVYEYFDDKREEFFNEIADADAIINTVVKMDREAMSRAKKLKCLALNGVGFNMADVEAATDHGIMVCPASEYCTDEVSEHTFSLILALVRGLRTFINAAENHVWDYRAAGTLKRLKGQTIAIFGYGKIGRSVVEKAKAFGMRVLVVSGHMTQEQAKQEGVELVSWEEAFAQSHIDDVSQLAVTWRSYKKQYGK